MDNAKPNKDVVIVTGSSGFIGYRLCQRLLKNYTVVGFDRPGLPNPPPAATCIEVDVTDEAEVAKAFKTVRQRFGERIASVVHLAAYYDFSGKPSSKYDEITVQGTGRLMRHLKAFTVEQFIFSSTMLVYAPGEVGRPIKEDHPLEPKWDYPKSKVKTEELLKREHESIPILSARIAGVYDDDCHSIPLAHQMQRIYERTLTSHLFPGDLSHGQSFLHVDDMVAFLVQAVDRRKNLPADSVFLVGEPQTLSYGQLQHEFGKLINNEEWNTIRVPKWFAKLGAWLQEHVPFVPAPFIRPWMIDLADDHYEMDISYAQKAIGWSPARRLIDVIPIMVGLLKKDPAKWYKINKLNSGK